MASGKDRSLEFVWILANYVESLGANAPGGAEHRNVRLFFIFSSHANAFDM